MLRVLLVVRVKLFYSTDKKKTDIPHEYSDADPASAWHGRDHRPAVPPAPGSEGSLVLGICTAVCLQTDYDL